MRTARATSRGERLWEVCVMVHRWVRAFLRRRQADLRHGEIDLFAGARASDSVLVAQDDLARRRHVKAHCFLSFAWSTSEATPDAIATNTRPARLHTPTRMNPRYASCELHPANSALVTVAYCPSRHSLQYESDRTSCSYEGVSKSGTPSGTSLKRSVFCYGQLRVSDYRW